MATIHQRTHERTHDRTRTAAHTRTRAPSHTRTSEGGSEGGYLERRITGDSREEAELQNERARTGQGGHRCFSLGDAVSQVDLRNTQHATHDTWHARRELVCQRVA
jgi:hypothetical protein